MICVSAATRSTLFDALDAGPRHGRAAIDHLTLRIWRMEQQAIRFSLRELGVPVVDWDGEQSPSTCRWRRTRGRP